VVLVRIENWEIDVHIGRATNERGVCGKKEEGDKVGIIIRRLTQHIFRRASLCSPGRELRASLI
jgi:hypothetical protein